MDSIVSSVGIDFSLLFNERTLLFTLYFSLIHGGLWYCLPMVFPTWWKSLAPKKHREMVPCIANLFHHFVVAPAGLYIAYRHYFVASKVTTEEIVLVSPFCFGYLIADTLFFALPQLLQGKYDYMIHHLLGIYLIGAAFSATNPDVLIVAAHLMISELSTIVLNIGMVLRKTSYKDSSIITLCNFIFLILFFLTRVVNLSYQVFTAWEAAAELGAARYLLVPILILQYFWFYKIVQLAFGPQTPSKEKSDKDA